MALSIDGTTGISGVDGSASAPAVTGTDSNTGINFASDTVNINTGGSTRATVDSSGSLGVGTTSPSSFNADGRNLVVGGGAANTGITIASSSATGLGKLFFAREDPATGSNNRKGLIAYEHQNETMTFHTGVDRRMLIDSSGSIILTGNTTSKGNIDNGSSSGAYFNSAGQLNTSRSTTSNSVHVTFNNSNGTVGTITTSGTSTGFNTSSDYRLKENATSISDGITRLKTLKPYRFNFKADSKTTVDGFLAHEVTAVPEAITGTKDEVDSDNNPVYQGIDQSKLVPLLTAALQEAIAKIEVLETKVATLEAG